MDENTVDQAMIDAWEDAHEEHLDRQLEHFEVHEPTEYERLLAAADQAAEAVAHYEATVLGFTGEMRWIEPVR